MFDIIYADCPWPYYGSPSKNAAAGKHYPLMLEDQIKQLDIRGISNKPAALFLWITGPKLDLGVETLKAWGFHYRGIAHIWVKTRQDGAIMGARGVPPTYSKPTTELLLLGTTCPRGRPFKLLSSKLPQVVLAPVGKHSEKPEIFRTLIEEGYGTDRSKIELFARKTTPGWTSVGYALDGKGIVASLAELTKTLEVGKHE